MSATTRPSTRAEARQLVQSIAKENGHISQEILDRMPDADRSEVMDALRMKDRLIASSVVTLAENLYTSNARFVFELLQNAEDNHFTKARAHGEAPKVSFRMYPNHVVLECNEDGFTEANLRAICAVGQSSKTGARGYIGEKGIGFKSVFMAAYQVHVQSGHFSFHFLHRQGDPGMGMITPVWEEDGEYLGDRCTRITLDLQQGATPEEHATRRATIRQQFHEIHDTILLFMKKIQEIKIEFYDQEMGEPGEPVSIITHSIERQDMRAVCHKHTSRMGQERAERRYYHITKQTVTGLARAEGRSSSAPEETSGADSQGEVVLAFPLTADSVPVLENQWLFAFLPVRQMGFKFLIQADFVTQANRQDIVTTSARNHGLASGIAEAFIKGVLELCDHQTLQYQWMRYLPEESAYPWDDFWKGVIVEIKGHVMSTPVLRPAIPGPLRLIRDSLRHLPSHLDASGEPLLLDVAPGFYLSRDYQSADLDRLNSLGLRYTSMVELNLRARSDLASPTSRIRTTQDEDWQSRLARLLHTPFAMGWGDRCREVRELGLLPLRDGSWTSATFGPIYHSKVEGTDLDVPPGLPLKVIDPRAADNVSRKQLFDAVGVTNAPVSLVRAAVVERYNNAHPTLAESVAYLRFLYIAESFVGPLREPRRFRIYSHRGQLEDASQVDVYARDDAYPYGAVTLLGPTEPGAEPGCGAPGFDVLFAHDAYYEDHPRRTRPGNWAEWLAEHCGVQHGLPLTQVDQDGTEVIDPVCRYIARHRPEKYLGFLCHRWEPYGMMDDWVPDSPIIREFGRVPVLCTGPGTNLRPLDSTYLPIGELMTLSRRFMIEGEFFPWLRLETRLSNDTTPTEWSSLAAAFGLGYNRDLLDFTLVVLKHILEANSSAEALEQPERIYALYGYLQAKVDESSNGAACREKIRSVFASQLFIFVPQGETHRPTWATSRDCLWRAPVAMRTKYALARAYAQTSPRGTLSRLETFFVHTVGVPNCMWEHIVEELRDCRTRSGISLERARELYKCLSDMRLIGISARDLKRTFEGEALICGFDGSWYTAPDCLWSSNTSIRGKLILNILYGDLRNFFVETLGVSELTAGMVYDKLTAQDGGNLSLEEAKETLIAFNSFLAIGRDQFDPAPVLANRVFPVRFPSGEVRLRTGTEGFALMDRKSLGEDFMRVAKFLDFGMDEIRTLQPLIQWAGLGDRYLSKSVKEVSRADRETTHPISSPHRDIRRKAYALLRIAVTYNSPRTQNDQAALYALLQASETFETARITAELLLTQDDEVLRVEKESASLHIHEGTDGLRVYVPRDNRSQEVCFNSKLPRRLCEWIMTDPTTQSVTPVFPDAVTVVQSVLNAQPFALDDILDEHGIADVDVADSNVELPVADNMEANTGVARGSTPATIPGEADNGGLLWLETAPSRHRSQTSFGSNDSPGLLTPLSSVASPELVTTSYITAQSSHRASRPRLPVMSAYRVPEEDQYLSLLRRVVGAARRATFPSRGTFDMSALNAALPGSPGDNDAAAELYRLRSTSQIERDRRIGAAGELFVFELLSNLQPQLPGFSRANWQSTIRGYVAAHPEYSDMAAWAGRETADITYSDVEGAFTRLLIDKGYLGAETWAGARPHYFIEVKTTTGSCSTPFFMSKWQYRRMQANTSDHNDNRQTVYVIFRVFSVGTDNTGLRVLVDPESMRVRGELSFTAESWSVVAAG